MTAFNVYCDESGHLEHDHQKVMVLGALACPTAKAREIADRLREIKRAHGLPPGFELKWTKVSPAKVAFYQAVLDYFFDDDDLCFRALVVPDKAQLDHARFGQTHDDFYYKSYFALLKALLGPDDTFRIFLDIKDTRGTARVARLHEVLANSVYDFRRQIVQTIQQVRSEQVVQLQLADLLIGAVGYLHRGLDDNAGKLALVRRMQARSGYQLLRSTLLRERKVNLFVWRPQPGAPGVIDG